MKKGAGFKKDQKRKSNIESNSINKLKNLKFKTQNLYNNILQLNTTKLCVSNFKLNLLSTNFKLVYKRNLSIFFYKLMYFQQTEVDVSIELTNNQALVNINIPSEDVHETLEETVPETLEETGQEDVDNPIPNNSNFYKYPLLFGLFSILTYILYKSV